MVHRRIPGAVLLCAIGLIGAAAIAPARAFDNPTIGNSAAPVPDWAKPYMSSAYGSSTSNLANAGYGGGTSYGSGPSNLAGAEPANTARIGSGTVGMYYESGSQASPYSGPNGILGNFSPPPFAATPLSSNWLGMSSGNLAFGNLSWQNSIGGNYKSDPIAGLGGLYTTASFGVANFKTNPLGFSPLNNSYDASNVAAMTARAGIGYQVTPHLTIEGSVGFTQMPSGFR